MPPEPRVYATPPRMPVAPLANVPDGAARGFRLQVKQGRFDGVVVRSGERVFGYVDLCPHAGVPLASAPDGYEVHAVSTGLLLACRWHGALFQAGDGACVAGPCVGQRLAAWPVTVARGMIVTAGDGPRPRWWMPSRWWR